MVGKLIPLEHPGTFLKEEFMEPFGLSSYKVTKDIGVSAMALSEILRGKRGISPKVGLRLAKYFGVSEGYFLRLQLQYEIDKLKEAEGKEIDSIEAVAG